MANTTKFCDQSRDWQFSLCKLGFLVIQKQKKCKIVKIAPLLYAKAAGLQAGSADDKTISS